MLTVSAVNSIVKAHFAWCWQSTTLNRGDELVNLPLAFLQPYAIRVADSNYLHDQPVGITREIFGILSMFWDTKTANADVCIVICKINVTQHSHHSFGRKMNLHTILLYHIGTPFTAQWVCLQSCCTLGLTKHTYYQKSLRGTGLRLHYGARFVPFEWIAQTLIDDN